MNAPADPSTAAGIGLVRRDCPGCGGSSRRPLPHYSRDPWTVVECTACGFVYLGEVPTYERLVSEIAWEKSYEAEKQRRSRERPVSFWISAKLRSLHQIGRKRRRQRARDFEPGAVLDIGCGRGDNLPEGHTPYGIELSEELHAVADRRMRERGGYVLHMTALEGLRSFPENFFSGAILSSYLEHEMQPREVLQELARVLKPGGRAYVRVPNYGSINRHVRGAHWAGFRHPDHVNYFTLETLKRMAGNCGFALKLLKPFMLPVDDNINAILVRR